MKNYGKIVLMILLVGMILAEGIILWGQVQENKNCEEQYVKLVEELQAQNVLIDNLKEEEAVLESKIFLFQAEKEEMEATIVNLKEKLEMLKTEQETLNRNIEDNTTQRNDLQNEIDSLERKIEQLEAELAS